jgi:tRNA(Ile)-lysidine synthase
MGFRIYMSLIQSWIALAQYLYFSSLVMLLNQFKQYITTHHLFQPKDRLLLAVSGGVDSVVLCELCHQAGYDFVIAHCNFQLRGEESNRDEAFVKTLGEKYGVEVVVKNFDTKAIAATEKKSIETTARDLRYEWFYEIIGERQEAKGERYKTNHQSLITDNWYILTAHHADDNIETAAMNFFRGTGIAGIRGMLTKQGKIIRPLLFARRSELEHFAKENKLAFVTDSTNAENEYTRNLFRNKILPQVAEAYPDALKNVLNNISRFGETEQLYQQAIALHKKKLIEQKGNEFHIPVLKLLKTEPLQTILYEIIKEFGFTAHQTNEAIALLKSETGKYIKSLSHRIIKNRNWLIITPNETEAAQNILIEAGEEKIVFANGALTIQRMSKAEHRMKHSALIAQLDINDIVFPLLLRKWKQGDYFYPLGMNKKKKLSRFFIDQKLSLPEKENTWVVEMDKKIIWVVGVRIDNRFKITHTTEQVLLMELVKK